MSPKPHCMIVTGPPGAGKTTLAKILAERLHLPLISRDALKEGYVSTYGLCHDELPPDTNGRITTLFFELVLQHLAGQVSLVIEAAFQHPLWAAHLPALQAASHPFCLICTLDQQLAAERQQARRQTDPHHQFFHGNPTPLLPRPYIPPALAVPTLYINTTNGYSPALDKLLGKLREFCQPPG